MKKRKKKSMHLVPKHNGLNGASTVIDASMLADAHAMSLHEQEVPKPSAPRRVTALPLWEGWIDRDSRTLGDVRPSGVPYVTVAAKCWYDARNLAMIELQCGQGELRVVERPADRQ